MTQPTSGALLGNLRSDLPLALLPVRIETRYLGGPGDRQLQIRVYPDDVHVNSYEPQLTEVEAEWGEHFWRQIWQADGDPGREQAAWDQVVERFGAPRAAHIAEATRPTNLAERPGRAPTFPRRALRTETWAQTPNTNVLPDRWVALGYADGRRVFEVWGNPIPDVLAVAPSPTQRGFLAEEMAADPTVGWLVDFPAAERVGMGLRVTPRDGLPVDGRLDRLVVLGAKASLSGAQGAARLSDLLTAHRFTSGLAFVPQGTPSNNTPAARSGYSARESPSFDVRAYERPLPADPGDAANRVVTVRALGLRAEVLDRVPHAQDGEQRDAYHMNTALWKATWGYFLEQLVAGTGALPDDVIRQAREHFASYVRARGPLPALRVGQQPYGVLPIASLDLWPRAGSSFNERLARLLHTLRGHWRTVVDSVPRLPGREDRAEELLRVLAMEPTSVDYLARPGRPLVLLPAQAGQLAPQPDQMPVRAGSADALTLAAELGLTWTPRLARTTFRPSPDVTPLPGRRVQPLAPGAEPGPETLSETIGIQPNYLAWLRDAGYADLQSRLPTPRPDALLFLLLRHAALLEYVGAAFRVLRRGPTPAVGPNARREPDLADVRTPTPAGLLTTAAAGLTPAPVGAYLDSVKPRLRAESGRDVTASGAIWRRSLYDVGTTVPADVAVEVRELAAHTRSLDYLAGRPAAVLGRLLAETLDLASHRLDAWVTSLATQRLEQVRAQAPTGVYLGGYGWVEALAPAPAPQDVPPPQLPPSEVAAPELQEPLSVSAANKGFVHAPSLAHATTAALLRSGYLARQVSGDAEALAVNVSSERVRVALWLLDGVRQGQPLGGLLGYRFERGLHDRRPDLLLDRYIPSFRRLAPRDGVPAAAASPSGGAIDGLELLRRWRLGRRDVPQSWTPASIPFGARVAPDTPVLPPATSGQPEFEAIAAELVGLADAVDAIGDLVIAESVHQVAQGNPVRAGATLESVAHGEAPPPDLDFIRTPRTGVGLTHRIIALFGQPPGGQTWGSTTPRARAEPVLNAWSAQLLGPGAASARCRVEYFDRGTLAPFLDAQGRPVHVDIALADLQLAPLDVVYLAAAAGDNQRSDLEQRVVYRALRPAEPPAGDPEPAGVRPAAVPETAGVRLTFARPPGAPVTTVGFAEVLEQARTVRRLVAGARPVDARDLALPQAAPGAGTDLAELTGRAGAAVEGLTRALGEMRDALTTADVPTLRLALMRAAGTGVRGAMPVAAVGAGEAEQRALIDQGQSVELELTARLTAMQLAEHQLEDRRSRGEVTADEDRDHQLQRLRDVFGEDFRVVPRFRVANAPDLASTFGASRTLQDDDELEVVRWFQRASRVRDGAARLDATLLYAEALGGPPSGFTVGQLPLPTDPSVADRWVGLPLVESADDSTDEPPPRLPGGRLSLVVRGTWVDLPRLTATATLAGLLIDEWVEVVPGAEETTGLTFHYNRPNVRAPQAILLAVTADGQPWSLARLETTLLETIEWSKLRGVDLRGLPDDLAHYLPALYFAQNPATAAVASDFSPVQ